MPDSGCPATPSLLSVEGVTLRYRTESRTVTAVRDISFDVHRGERFVILGQSGCGKSTLLKAIAGFHAPQQGRIVLDGRPVSRPGPDRIMVFQEFDQLLPWKTARENIVFALVETGTPPRDARESADRHLAKVGLAGVADRHVHQLSGGMKQRVAIARAMALEPAILLMDEPFAALDALTRRAMQDELLRLWDEIGFTLVFITHSIEEAVILGSRLLLLTPHPGRVRAELDVPSGLDAAEAGRFAARVHGLLFDAPEPETVRHG